MASSCDLAHQLFTSAQLDKAAVLAHTETRKVSPSNVWGTSPWNLSQFKQIQVHTSS